MQMAEAIERTARPRPFLPFGRVHGIPTPVAMFCWLVARLSSLATLHIPVHGLEIFGFLLRISLP